jgi:hypothetical protein
MPTNLESFIVQIARKRRRTVLSYSSEEDDLPDLLCGILTT